MFGSFISLLIQLGWFYVIIRLVFRLARRGGRKEEGSSSKTAAGQGNYGNGSRPLTGSFGYENTAGQKESGKIVSKAPGQEDKGKKDKQTELSTLEYLEQKAREDAREHAREAMEERRQARKDLAGRREGIRLYPGDAAPRGMRVIKCPYCGAENLVAENSREKYGCYFCREDLQ